MPRCKVCMNSFDSLLRGERICASCFRRLEVLFETKRIEDVSGRILYAYNDFFRNLLYLFKGCGDYELREVFLSRFRRELKIRFAGYSVIPAPSNEAEDEKRGYNHVVEIAKSLDLPILPLLFKNKPFKQSARSFSERRKVRDDLSLKNGSPIVGKKILLMDDVVTTGETMKAMIDLVRPLRPKKIRFLVLATKKD